jgi:hypothetical protein
LVHVFRVITDGYAESITGEEAFRYTVTFLSQGDLAVRTVVDGMIDPIVVPSTMSVGDVERASASVNGRVYTNGVEWTSDNPAVASVSTAGVITAVSAGTANIKAVFEANGDYDEVPVTVS